MKRSSLDFTRMSDRQCWDWLADHLRGRESDPRVSATTFKVARGQETLALACLDELRTRGTQLTMLPDANDRLSYGNASS
jgi:hypothetical protein